MSGNEPLDYLPQATRRPGRERGLCPRDELQILQEIGETILTSSDIKVVLTEILNKVLSTVSFDLGVIGLVRRTSDRIGPIPTEDFTTPNRYTLVFLKSTASYPGTVPNRRRIRERRFTRIFRKPRARTG